MDGPLGHAIRASLCVAGCFQACITPEPSYGRRALVNPVPVSVCTAFEAEIVVAVNLNSETFGRSAVVRSTSIHRTKMCRYK